MSLILLEPTKEPACLPSHPSPPRFWISDNETVAKDDEAKCPLYRSDVDFGFSTLFNLMVQLEVRPGVDHFISRDLGSCSFTGTRSHPRKRSQAEPGFLDVLSNLIIHKLRKGFGLCFWENPILENHGKRNFPLTVRWANSFPEFRSKPAWLGLAHD